MMNNSNPYELERVSVRLVKDAPLYSEEPLNSPEKVVKALGRELSEMDREVVCIINMTTKSVPINCTIASIGTIDATITVPRDLLKASILSNAASVIMLHNHPSGDPSPSMDDIRITARVGAACELLGIELLDHIIVGGRNERYYSFNENHILQNAKDYKRRIAQETQNMEQSLIAAEKERAR